MLDTAGASSGGPAQAAWQASAEALFRVWPALRALLLAGAVERLAACADAQGPSRSETLTENPRPCRPALLRAWAERLLAPPGKARRGAKRKAPDGKGGGQKAAPGGGAPPWAPAPAQAAALLRSCLLALGAAAPCRVLDPVPGPGAAPLPLGAPAEPTRTSGSGAAEPSGRVPVVAPGGAGAAAAALSAAPGGVDREPSAERERLAALRWLAAALAPHAMQAHAREGRAAAPSAGAPANPGGGPAAPALAARAQALARLASPTAAHAGAAGASAAADTRPAAGTGPTALERARGAQAALLRRAEPADAPQQRRAWHCSEFALMCAQLSAQLHALCVQACARSLEGLPGDASDPE